MLHLWSIFQIYCHRIVSSGDAILPWLLLIIFLYQCSGICVWDNYDLILTSKFVFVSYVFFCFCLYFHFLVYVACISSGLNDLSSIKESLSKSWPDLLLVSLPLVHHGVSILFIGVTYTWAAEVGSLICLLKNVA